MTIRWEQAETGALLYSGSVAIGSVGKTWSAGKPDGYYYWELDLPGEQREGLAETIAEAKSLCSYAFLRWCEAADLL